MPIRKRARRLPFELRLLWWLVRLTWKGASHLSYALLAALGSLLWLLGWPLRRRPEVAIEWPTADAFYRSHRWRRLRIDALEGNRERYGALTCECCLTTRTGQWHVDHVQPRATLPGAGARAHEPAGALRRLQPRQGHPLRDRLARRGAGLRPRGAAGLLTCGFSSMPTFWLTNCSV